MNKSLSSDILISVSQISFPSLCLPLFFHFPRSGFGTADILDFDKVQFINLSFMVFHD